MGCLQSISDLCPDETPDGAFLSVHPSTFRYRWWWTGVHANDDGVLTTVPAIPLREEERFLPPELSKTVGFPIGAGPPP